MSEFDTTGGYAFVPYRPPRRVWSEFRAYWGRTRPGLPLPEPHNLPALTGLSEWQLRRLGAIPAKRRKPRPNASTLP